MTFPTISAGTRANEAIGGYANFVAYCNALAAGVDSVTTTAAGAALKANNLSDLTSASTARTNLGLGTAAVADTGTGASNVILGNDARLTDTRTPTAASIVDAMIATTLSPSKITGTAAILGANTFTAQQFIDGSADAIQLRVQGHSTQTTDYFRVETSAGTSVGGWDQYGQLTTQYVTNLTSVGPYIRLQSASQIAINSGNAANVPWAVRGMAAQSGDLFQAQNSGGSVLASISAAGLHRWNSAGNEQTTVGAAGGASALPGAPTKYLKVVDSSGATLVIPAYAAA